MGQSLLAVGQAHLAAVNYRMLSYSSGDRWGQLPGDVVKQLGQRLQDKLGDRAGPLLKMVERLQQATEPKD